MIGPAVLDELTGELGLKDFLERPSRFLRVGLKPRPDGSGNVLDASLRHSTASR
jgi:hypothetical protein